MSRPEKLRLLTGPHHPDRPGWVCRYCALPYPCPRGRDQLVAAHGLTPELGREAYGMLEQAVPELVDVSVAGLWDRFVAWTEPVRVNWP